MYINLKGEKFELSKMDKQHLINALCSNIKSKCRGILERDESINQLKEEILKRMAITSTDPVIDLQIQTVPLKNNSLKESDDLDDPINIIRNSDDDYMDYINQEVQELNN